MNLRNNLVSVGFVGVVLLSVWLGYARLSEMQADARLGRDAAQQQAALLTKKIDRFQADLIAAELNEAQTAQIWRAAGDDLPIGDAQRVLSSVIGEAGGMILAMSDIQETTVGNLDSLRLSVEAEADLEQWQNVMRDLAQNEPVILVSSVEMRRINRVMPGSTQPLVLFRLNVEIPFAREAS